jgi:hypothetical protein
VNNQPGEWCVAYHGTKEALVKSHTENRLVAGPHNQFGYGIYSSPNPSMAERNADIATMKKKKGYPKHDEDNMFMCRVNTRLYRVHPHVLMHVPRHIRCISQRRTYGLSSARSRITGVRTFANMAF